MGILQHKKNFSPALPLLLWLLLAAPSSRAAAASPIPAPSPRFSLFAQAGPLGLGLGFSWLPSPQWLLSLGSGYAGSAWSLGLEGRYLLGTGHARPYAALGAVDYFISGGNGGGNLASFYAGPGFEYAFDGGWALSAGLDWAKGLASSGNAGSYSLASDLLSDKTLVLFTQFEVRKYW